MDLHKKQIITAKWAEVSSDLTGLSDDELVDRIKQYEDVLTAAQTAYECAKEERHSRAKNLRSKFANEQRENDRLYIPKPADKLAYDKKAREEKVKLSADEKAVQKLMSFGMSEAEAIEVLTKGKEGKVS